MSEGTSSKYQPFQQGHQVFSEIPTTLYELRKINSNWSVDHRQERGLFLLEHLFHTATTMMQKEKQWQRNWCNCSYHPEMAKETAPIHPSEGSLQGSSEEEILKSTEEVYWGSYVLSFSKLPHQQQEECMTELHAELGWCMARTGLRDVPVVDRPTSQGRRCSHAHSGSWACSPTARNRRGEMAKWLRESSANRWSRSQSQCSQSRHRGSHHLSRFQWCQSPFPWGVHFGRYISPCLNPPNPHPTDEQLNCSLSDLHLHP